MQISFINENNWIGDEVLVIGNTPYPFSIISNSKVVLYEITLEDAYAKIPKEVLVNLEKNSKKKIEFLQDRIMNICKSVNEVSKWDNFYKDYSERIKEVSMKFSQASNSAVSNLKNIPIISDITTGAISRFQNKMANKSPNFKNVLHTRSQTHIEGFDKYDITVNTLNEKLLKLTDMNSMRTSLPDIRPNEDLTERVLETNYSTEPSPVKSIANLKNVRSAADLMMTQEESSNELQLYSTRQPSPEKTSSLYRNLSIPQILVQQKKFAQMGKLIMEWKTNPRFKEVCFT